MFERVGRTAGRADARNAGGREMNRFSNRTHPIDAKNPTDAGICEFCPLRQYAPTEQCLDCPKAKEFYKNLKANHE
jgi:hypothetical protein